MTVLRIYSIFNSIQGESTFAGLPCVFIRLAGCPLDCSYCDTRDACVSTGIDLSIEDIVGRVEDFDCNLIEVTGGEPLAQKGTPELLSVLCDAGYDVLLETSGAFSIKEIDSRVNVVIDIKTPGSGMADRNFDGNYDFLGTQLHQAKFVVTSKGDFDFAVAQYNKYQNLRSVPVLISPIPEIDRELVAKWIISSGLPFRLQLQLHKLIWPNSKEEK